MEDDGYKSGGILRIAYESAEADVDALRAELRKTKAKLAAMAKTKDDWKARAQTAEVRIEWALAEAAQMKARMVAQAKEIWAQSGQRAGLEQHKGDTDE
jgi:multidrug efflux pump subunit AcrB